MDTQVVEFKSELCDLFSSTTVYDLSGIIYLSCYSVSITLDTLLKISHMFLPLPFLFSARQTSLWPPKTIFGVFRCSYLELSGVKLDWTFHTIWNGLCSNVNHERYLCPTLAAWLSLYIKKAIRNFKNKLIQNVTHSMKRKFLHKNIWEPINWLRNILWNGFFGLHHLKVIEYIYYVGKTHHIHGFHSF